MLKASNKTKYKQTEIGEIPEDWKIVSLGDVALFQNGKSSPDRNDDFKYPVYGSNGMIGFSNKSNSEPGSIIIGRVGSYCGSLYYTNQPSWITDNAIRATSKNENDSKFIFYLLHTLNLNSRSGGSGQPLLNQQILQSIPIAAPNLNEQQQIASILSSLDDKIELNRRMNKTLEEIGKTLFKRWFVDFEFPDENGEPYKSSGGEMVESELGMIPRGWKVFKLGDYFPVITGKQNANIATENGEFPFYTCSQDISRADQFSFDASALLLAGNGDFNIKWYIGKFEAYQRTYVLIPHNKAYLAWLYYMMDHFLNNMTAGHRGSVIKFITKGMIEDYLVAVPKQPDAYIELFQSINECIDANKREIFNIAQQRDSLLPRLMSGKIRVNKYEK